MIDLDLKSGSVSVMSTDMYIECAKEKLSRLKSEMYDLQKHIEELSHKQGKQEVVATPDSAQEYIRNKMYEVFYENKIVVSGNKVARICAYLQTPEGEEYFKVKTNNGEYSWEPKDWVDTHIAE